MFIVNKKNPLAGLSLDQIDGIYGAARTGGWDGTKWTTAAARGPEKDLRTWGQLGITGELANQPIRLHGSDVTLSNWADLIEREAFHGGTKWNPTLTEAPRADISTKAKGKTRDQLILEAVENDPAAIGFIFQRVINANHGDVKVLPLARSASGPFVTPNAQTFFDGSYANFVGDPNSGGASMGFGALKRGLNDDLKKDRYGIAYVASPVGPNLPAECKVLEVAETATSPAYAYTIDNIRSRKYPFYDEIYAYIDAKPGQPMDPKVREYLRFIVSRDGQAEIARDGKYLPLTAEVSRAQLKKLQ